MPGPSPQSMDIGDPAAPNPPASLTGLTAAVPDSSPQSMDIGDPAAPNSPADPTGFTRTASNTLRSNTGGMAPRSLNAHESPQKSGPPFRSEHASTYGVRLTDAEGRPRNPAIINGRSELQAFGFPLTGPHPVFSKKLTPGSHWYRYESILGRGSVDYMARPRSLDFSQFDCSHLFVWPNPSGGGFIFLLTDTPVSSKPDLGRLEGPSEDEDYPILAALPSAPQNAEPLTPPSTPPSTPPPGEDVRMHSPPSEDVRMQSPPLARPRSPGTPPGTSPSQRRGNAVRTPSYSPTCPQSGDRRSISGSHSRASRWDHSTSTPYHDSSAERVGRRPSTYHRTSHPTDQRGLGFFNRRNRVERPVSYCLISHYHTN
jgi:hypothetical protein